MSQIPDGSLPVEVAGGVPVVTAPEQIDFTNAAGLRAAVLQAAGQGHGTVVVDMTGTGSAIRRGCTCW